MVEYIPGNSYLSTSIVWLWDKLWAAEVQYTNPVFFSVLSQVVSGYYIVDPQLILLNKEDSVNLEKTVLFSGTCRTSFIVTKRGIWNPGTLIQSVRDYDVLVWSELLRKDYLNFDFILLPAYIALELPEKGKFFRPNSGFKSFVGSCDIANLAKSQVEPTTLVVVSSAKTILAEYRCVILEDSILSMHVYNDQEVTLPIYLEGWNFAKNVAKKLHQDILFEESVYILDICYTSEQVWKVVEVNAFSCAMIYETQPEVILSMLTAIVDYACH